MIPEVIGGCKCSRLKRIPGVSKRRELHSGKIEDEGALWMRICRVCFTGRGRVTFNSTAYRDDGAGAHKSVYESKKDNK